MRSNCAREKARTTTLFSFFLNIFKPPFDATKENVFE